MAASPTTQDYTFTTSVGIAPYSAGDIRFRKGIRQTAFHPLIGERGSLLKVHNTFLKPYFLDDVLAEYWALREVAGLFDVTGEEIVEVTGPEALPFMNELVTRDLRRQADGQCLYGIMCYDYGGIVEDAVLVRFSAEKFWWIGGLGNSEQWIYGNSIGRDVTVRSLLDHKAIASLQGPRSREILQGLAGADITGLPFYHMMETQVCGVDCVVTRTGYTAELGFEVIVDNADGLAVFAGLSEACEAAGGALCGSGATELRRVEAGLIDFGSDFDWHHSPFQVGLGWMVNMKKDAFHGRAALAAEAAGPARPRLAGLQLDGQVAPSKGDKVLVAGKPVGEVTSGVLSPALETVIAIAMLAAGASAPGQPVEVALSGGAVGGQVVPMPFLDPERKLSKG